MGVRNGQIDCEGDGFLTFLVSNFASFCIDSMRRGHDVALIVSEMITLTWCELVGRLSSNVHACVHGFFRSS